jgi:hypothetical protein
MAQGKGQGARGKKSNLDLVYVLPHALCPMLPAITSLNHTMIVHQWHTSLH